MQDFHCNNIKNKYGDKSEMLLTHTDSLMCKVEAENVQEDFCKDKELFDFSNYPKYFQYKYNVNNLVVGKMKNKTSGVPIKCFAGLKSKI